MDNKQKIIGYKIIIAKELYEHWIERLTANESLSIAITGYLLGQAKPIYMKHVEE